MTKIINTTLKNVCFAGGKGGFVGDARTKQNLQHGLS